MTFSILTSSSDFYVLKLLSRDNISKKKLNSQVLSIQEEKKVNLKQLLVNVTTEYTFNKVLMIRQRGRLLHAVMAEDFLL